MPSSDARRCAIRLMRLPPSMVDRAARQSAGPLLIAATEAGASKSAIGVAADQFEPALFLFATARLGRDHEPPGKDAPSAFFPGGNEPTGGSMGMSNCNIRCFPSPNNGRHDENNIEEMIATSRWSAQFTEWSSRNIRRSSSWSCRPAALAAQLPDGMKLTYTTRRPIARRRPAELR